jgi:hypothetical protein
MNTPRLSEADLVSAEYFWARRFGTHEIARFLKTSEAAVANSLADLREARRAEKRVRVSA